MLSFERVLRIIFLMVFCRFYLESVIAFFFQSAVTRNYSEKSINSILDYISTSKQMDLLQDFYETTLEALKGTLLFARNTTRHNIQKFSMSCGF